MSRFQRCEAINVSMGGRCSAPAKFANRGRRVCGRHRRPWIRFAEVEPEVVDAKAEMATSNACPRPITRAHQSTLAISPTAHEPDSAISLATCPRHRTADSASRLARRLIGAPHDHQTAAATASRPRARPAPTLTQRAPCIGSSPGGRRRRMRTRESSLASTASVSSPWRRSRSYLRTGVGSEEWGRRTKIPVRSGHSSIGRPPSAFTQPTRRARPATRLTSMARAFVAAGRAASPVSTGGGSARRARGDHALPRSALLADGSVSVGYMLPGRIERVAVTEEFGLDDPAE